MFFLIRKKGEPGIRQGQGRFGAGGLVESPGTLVVLNQGNHGELSNEKRALGCFVYKGDYSYTTQFYRDYNKFNLYKDPC